MASTIPGQSSLPPSPGQQTPFTISRATALAVIGMSWVWCLRFARAHGVEILRVGERKQLIVYADLIAAMRRYSSAHEPERELTVEQQTDALLAELGYVPVQGGAS